MTTFEVFLDGDGVWPDVQGSASMSGVAMLKKGTTNGGYSVAVRFVTESGQVLIGQTTLKCLGTAVDLMRERVALDARAN